MAQTDILRDISAVPPAANKCQRLEQETGILLPPRAGGAGGDWRPFRRCGRKRNSVNPPLIRYNDSLVVCPVSSTTSLRPSGGAGSLRPGKHLDQSPSRGQQRCREAAQLLLGAGSRLLNRRPGRMFPDHHVSDRTNRRGVHANFGRELPN